LYFTICIAARLPTNTIKPPNEGFLRDEGRSAKYYARNPAQEASQDPAGESDWTASTPSAQ